MGLLIAADILGFALFQLMQVRLGTVDGASTQIVMMLTSFCYMPAVGIAMAGTTLVGQAIGAHQPRLGVQGRQRHHLDGGALHGRDRRAARGRGPLGAAVLHQSRGSGGGAPWWRGAVRCCGLPPVISCSMASTSAAAPACAAPAMCAFRPSWYLRYPGCCSCRLRTACRLRRARVGRLAAAVRLGRGRRMVCRVDLCLLPGIDAVSSLAVRRLAAHRAASQLSDEIESAL